MGFDAIALDLVNGPPEVLNMLCHDCSLHNTPVSRREFNPDQLKACEKIPAIYNFIHGKNSVGVRRRYGITGSSSKRCRQATIYSSQNVDETQKNELERSIRSLEDEHKKIREELDLKKVEHGGLRKRILEIQKEQKDTSDKKNRKQQELAEFTHLKAQCKSLQDKLKEKTQGGSGHREEIERLEKKLNKLSMKRASIVQDVEVCGLSIPSLRVWALMGGAASGGRGRGASWRTYQAPHPLCGGNELRKALRREKCGYYREEK